MSAGVISNITMAKFQSQVIYNFNNFLANLSPISIQLIFIIVGSPIITDILTPLQVQSIVVFLPLQNLRNVCLSIVPLSDYTTRETIFKMTYTQLQNYVNNLSQIQVLAMVQKIVLLTVQDLQNFFQNIPAIQLKTLVSGFTSSQLAILQTRLLTLSFIQAFPLLQTISFASVENFCDLKIGIQ